MSFYALDPIDAYIRQIKKNNNLRPKHITFDRERETPVSFMDGGLEVSGVNMLFLICLSGLIKVLDSANGRNNTVDGIINLLVCLSGFNNVLVAVNGSTSVTSVRGGQRSSKKGLPVRSWFFCHRS